MKRYANNPINVRLYEQQNDVLNELVRDKEYCKQNGIYSVSDFVRSNINNGLKQYELKKLGTV